jgi:hypothetical protein
MPHPSDTVARWVCMVVLGVRARVWMRVRSWVLTRLRFLLQSDVFTVLGV